MLAVLEKVAMQQGDICQGLYDYVKRCRNTYGNRGSVFLEYGWAQFNKHGRVMSEQDIMVALHNGSIGRWYEGLTKHLRPTKAKKVAICSNAQRLREQIAEAQAAKPKADKAKAIGDAYRAERLAAKQRQAEFAAQYKAEQALIAGLRKSVG
jgi:hypothetical protein